ncbi:MAG: hypothetical protein WAQ98_29760 [Blastocatellia bacterium]
MDIKEGVKFFNKRKAKVFLVRQDTNLLAKGSETSEVLEVNDNLNGSDNPLYMNYLDTIKLNPKEKV